MKVPEEIYFKEHKANGPDKIKNGYNLYYLLPHTL